MGRKMNKEKEKWLKRVAVLFLLTRVGFIGMGIGMIYGMFTRSLIGVYLFFGFAPLIIIPGIIIYLTRNKWKEDENRDTSRGQ